MMFGEHLGQPPGFGGYTSAGMRLVDNDLRSKLNGDLGNPFSGLNGLDASGAAGFDAAVSMMHAQIHDNDFAAVKELQHAFYFTRAGLPLIYTDGNYQSETLGESGGAFPRHANTAFLGQFGDNRIPNVIYLHDHFARGEQVGKWSDGNGFYHTVENGTISVIILSGGYFAFSWRSPEASDPWVRLGRGAHHHL